MKDMMIKDKIKTKTRTQKVKVRKRSITKKTEKKPVIDFTKDFRDGFLTMRKIPISQAALEHLADLMREWAVSSTNNIVFKEFLVLQRIQHKQLSEWVKRSQKLQDAKDFTLMVLGVNREKGALLRRLDGSVVSKMQYRYDPDWGKAEERLFKLRAMSDSSGVTKDDLKLIVKDILKPIS